MKKHPIKTKDFRVLPVGTVLTQELRDEIFAALQERDRLTKIVTAGIPENLVWEWWSSIYPSMKEPDGQPVQSDLQPVQSDFDYLGGLGEQDADRDA